MNGNKIVDAVISFVWHKRVFHKLYLNLKNMLINLNNNFVSCKSLDISNLPQKHIGISGTYTITTDITDLNNELHKIWYYPQKNKPLNY